MSEPDLKKGEEGKKKSGTSSGRTSKTGSLIATLVRKESLSIGTHAGTKKGKETPTGTENVPSISMPVKPATQMKKRGEEDADSKFLSKAHRMVVF